MQMIVETGDTPNANSYVSLEEAEAYHALMQNEDWEGEDQRLEAALIVATKSIDTLYGAKFLSVVRDPSQSLLFPRKVFVDNNGRTVNGIPQALKNAVCEVALMRLNGEDVFPGVVEDDNIKSKTIEVGDLSKSVEFRKPTGSRTGFSRIETELACLLRGSNSSWKMRL